MKVEMTIYVNENDPNEIKVFASDEFINKNKDAEMKYAAEAAKANRQARLDDSRRILKFYNNQRVQQSQPQLSSLEQSQQQQSPKQQRSQRNNSNATSNNVLKHLQLMRRIAGENL
jgi:hypothetical protein